jgi:threonyl-tRNA synthetase
MQTDPIENIRYSASHIMAEAVTKIFPGAKLGIGPAIDDGFYYDFDLPCAVDPEKHFELIEQAMREIIAKDTPLIRREPI